MRSATVIAIIRAMFALPVTPVSACIHSIVRPTDGSIAAAW
jgi:hypothetical protein